MSDERHDLRPWLFNIAMILWISMMFAPSCSQVSRMERSLDDIHADLQALRRQAEKP